MDLIQFKMAPFAPDLKVDRNSGVIFGASVITGNITAKGHDLDVDEETLRQIVEFGNLRQKVPVKANHKSGVEAVTGYLMNFRAEGDQVRADWHLLESYPHRNQILETAEKMPECVGLSASFEPPEKPFIGPDKRTKARVKELVAVDYVTTPAANPKGLFSVPLIDNPANQKMDLTEITKLLKDLNAKVERQDKRIDLATGQVDLPQLAEMDEAQLAEYGLTPADVAQAVAALDDAPGEDDFTAEDIQALLTLSDSELAEAGIDRDSLNAFAAEMGIQAGDDAGQGDGDGDDIGPAGAAANAGGDAGATGLKALQRRLTNLEAHLENTELEAERAEIRHFFAGVEKTITELSDENKSLKTELDAARNTLRTVGRAHAVSFDSAGQPVEFGGHKAGSFEALVEQRLTELAEADPKASKTTLRAKAMADTVKNHEDAYIEMQERKGIRKTTTL
jgi:uncharacterized protein YjiS (DUF1127 family)